MGFIDYIKSSFSREVYGEKNPEKEPREPIYVPWGFVGKIIFVFIFAISILYMLPTITDYVSDNIFIDYNDRIPDDVLITVVVREGYTRTDNMIILFNTTKGELVNYDVCYVTENLELAPIQEWENWRYYLTDVKGYSLPKNSIYIEIYFAIDYW